MEFSFNDYLIAIRERDKEMRAKAKVYEDLGWVVVEPREDLAYVGPWIEENIEGEWRAFAHMWLFEKEDDATLFKLRWT